MYKVYLLLSLVDQKKSYVGKTIKPISERLYEHNNSLSPYTKAYTPWKLVYYETFYCELCADKREQFLISGFRFRLRKLLLDNYDKLK